MAEIKDKLKSLREYMSNNNLQAFIIPSADAHLSEYVADHWKCREWISGFTGSAGTVVVTMHKAGLWTDSRYFLQAGQQLENTGIDLYKMGLKQTPSITDFLIAELTQGSTVGIDGFLFADCEAQLMKETLEKEGINLNSENDPFQQIWQNRPAKPEDYAYAYPEELSGESIPQKKKRILDAAEAAGAECVLITALDEIAWALNMRGSDVECNPVAISYAVIGKNESIIFIDRDKLTDELIEYFHNNGIITAAYEKIIPYLNTLAAGTRILADGTKVSKRLTDAISGKAKIINTPSPIALMKAVKNQTEIKGFRNAMIKDGVALVKFFRWLEENAPKGNVTEIGVSEKLLQLREQQEGFVCESFATIAGWAHHGAIVHYEATEESNIPVTTDSLLLIDSGAQYLDGTTDITRTVAIGNPSDETRRDFTLVLKGHIGLAMAVFPEGTRGDQLDVLARQAMWKKHYNFLHGTGHGIGHFLNVHEGPQSIRMNHNPVTLLPGMVTSNEPGLYLAGKYGIRHENLVLTVEDGCGEFGRFFKFETLTLCPFDKNGIVSEMLSSEEKLWLNDYHKMVFDKLESHLSSEDRQWLAQKTSPLL